MVEQILRHVDCDRCGEGWTGPGDTSPPGWIGMEITSRGDCPGDLVSKRQHLCAKCEGKLARFLFNKDEGMGGDG